ncbi:NAD(P)-binding protein [Xylariaceae sp. FL1272]|nr:NAD(P)-binding protein [Xylariaceae sp. FL1272]
MSTSGSSLIVTGANGSLAVPLVERLLSTYPDRTVILAVRDTSDGDTNTRRLRETIGRHPQAKAYIHQVDLCKLASVNTFATDVAQGIQDGKYPAIGGIICTAYYWNLVGDQSALSEDGFDKTIQVNHLSHAKLVLHLLGHFAPEGGRILLFSSDAHWPGKNLFEKIPPAMPDDLNQLVRPPTLSDSNADGFLRYANSKLAIVMWVYALNRHLEKAQKSQRIVAIATNPGNLVDSRALRTNTPSKMIYMQRFLFKPFKVLLRSLADPTMQSAADAAGDVVDLVCNSAEREGGFYTLTNKTDSSPDSYNEEVQEKLWRHTLEWVGIEEVALGL